MNLNIKQKNIWILFVVFLGAALRFWKLGELPPSLNWDEVSHGYNAYSILKTGMDEWGVRLPLIFKAFGDYKLPVYIYLTSIPVWFFGLNAFAVRFVSALAGTLAIPGIYLLTKQLIPNNTEKKNTNFLPTIVALLLAISPWHFFISRPALEANVALTFIIFGFYYLLSFLKPATSSYKPLNLLLSSLFLSLSLHTYNTARVFVPLLLLATIIIYKSAFKAAIEKCFATKLSGFLMIFSILLFILSAFLVATQVFSGEATARYSKLQILSESAVYQIGEQRAKSTLSPIIAKSVFNRPVYFAKAVTSNYLKYFSPYFLYQANGAQYQFAIPGNNLLTLPVYLLVVIGFIFLISKLKNQSHQFVIAWLLFSPVAASLTADPPQALRPNPMIPILIIIASFGIFAFQNKLSKKFFILFVAATLLWTSIIFEKYFVLYSTHYKINYSSSWQFGYRQVVDFITIHKNEYTNIFITKRYGEPHIFYSFYSLLDPKLLQSTENSIRYKKSEWFWTDKINNVYFVNDWQIPTIGVNALTLESGQKISTQKSLLVTSPEHIPINAHVIQTINFLDGTPAFIITSIP